jgi:Arc/MetJ family transcription regulator
MRTNVDIDDELMAKALTATGLRTKKAVIHEALELLVRLRGQEKLRELRGAVQWEGDLDEMRRNRFPDWS